MVGVWSRVVCAAMVVVIIAAVHVLIIGVIGSIEVVVRVEVFLAEQISLAGAIGDVGYLDFAS